MVHRMVQIGDTSMYWFNYYMKNYAIGMADEIIVLSSNRNYEKWYDDNNIQVLFIGVDYKEDYLSHEESAVAQKRREGIVGNINNVDILQVHLCVGHRMFCFKKLIEKSRKSIMTYWGGDILNHSKRDLELNKEVVTKADVRIVMVEAMKREMLKIYPKLQEDQIVVLDFGADLKPLRSLIRNYSRNDCKREFKIPIDKMSIMIGYNAHKEHNHVKVIQALDELPREIKNRVFLYFQVSYGPEIGMNKYIQEIRDAAEKTGIEYYIDTEFYSRDKVLRLRIATDVFVHAQKTDALSATILEVLYSGGMLLNGKWIDYSELKDAGIEYVEFDRIEEVATIIENIVEKADKSVEKKNTLKNRETIFKLKDTSVFVDKWHKVLSI